MVTKKPAKKRTTVTKRYRDPVTKKFISKAKFYEIRAEQKRANKRARDARYRAKKRAQRAASPAAPKTPRKPLMALGNLSKAVADRPAIKRYLVTINRSKMKTDGIYTFVMVFRVVGSKQQLEKLAKESDSPDLQAKPKKGSQNEFVSIYTPWVYEGKLSDYEALELQILQSEMSRPMMQNAQSVEYLGTMITRKSMRDNA